MIFKLLKNTVLLFVLLGISCESKSQNSSSNNNTISINDTIISVGANQIDTYLKNIKGKRIGIVANQTSVIFKNAQDSIFLIDSETKEQRLDYLTPKYTHLVDSLLSLNINITKVFAPEHGFRGTADAGEKVKDGVDTKTGLPIISLYGNNKKPSKTQLNNIDIMIFDIQDVGARFYTYISSLHFVMEACAEANIPVIVLDRPNPNGHYIDGPILELEHQSFVGMHPVPVVHGMTIGEYAKMINGEGWLKNNVKADLTVIPIKNYSRTIPYSLPIKPSPNLPNDKAINLYPSLCFFEGTNVSVGRGTKKQFQIYGSPFLKNETANYSFTPYPNNGAKYPKHEGKESLGFDLTNEKQLDQINIQYLINAYLSTPNKEAFFIENGFFTKLAGTKTLQQQIKNGLPESKIKASWQQGLEAFKIKRAPYLIYP